MPAHPRKPNSVAVDALVVLPVIRRLIDELSLRLLVDRLPVAIHYPPRWRFPLYPPPAQIDPPIIKSNDRDENIPPFPVPTSPNSIGTRTHSKSASVPAVQLPPLSTTKQTLRTPSVASSRPTRVIKLPANPPFPATKSQNPSLSCLSTLTSTSYAASLSISSQVISRKSVMLSLRPPFGVPPALILNLHYHQRYRPLQIGAR